MDIGRLKSGRGAPELGAPGRTPGLGAPGRGAGLPGRGAGRGPPGLGAPGRTPGRGAPGRGAGLPGRGAGRRSGPCGGAASASRGSKDAVIPTVNRLTNEQRKVRLSIVFTSSNANRTGTYLQT